MGKRARAWADPLTRENRRQLRAQVGPLRTARVRPRTLSRYVHAVFHFYVLSIQNEGCSDLVPIFLLHVSQHLLGSFDELKSIEHWHVLVHDEQ